MWGVGPELGIGDGRTEKSVFLPFSANSCHPDCLFGFEAMGLTGPQGFFPGHYGLFSQGCAPVIGESGGWPG